MMNKEAIQKVINKLRSDDMISDRLYADPKSEMIDNYFDMGNFAHLRSCGAPACIAGHAVFLEDGNAKLKKYMDDQEDETENYVPIEEGYPFVRAQEIFDISYDDAFDLFIPDGVIYSLITATIAADVLENFMNTGEVVWPDVVHCDF